MKKLIRAVLERKRGRIGIAVVGGRRMRSLNKRFKRRDALTDVLAFDLGSGAKEIDGEIVVCSDAAISEARRRGGDPRDELALYVAHGLLHLKGMEDATPEGARRMHRRAVKLLRKTGWRDVE